MLAAILKAVVVARLEGKMKVPAAALLLFAVLAAGVEAGGLPEPISLIQRQPSNSHVSHYVRGPGRKAPAAMRMGDNDRHHTTWLTHGVRGK
jgi:hypothetical protein